LRVLRLSDVCLSRTSGLKSRTERPRKTKIGTEVAHVTSDTISRSKGQIAGAGAYCGGLSHSLFTETTLEMYNTYNWLLEKLRTKQMNALVATSKQKTDLTKITKCRIATLSRPV